MGMVILKTSHSLTHLVYEQLSFVKLLRSVLFALFSFTHLGLGIVSFVV